MLELLTYLRSLFSRKKYFCPQCGEEIQVELMEASRCSVCGARLVEIVKKEFNDESR